MSSWIKAPQRYHVKEATFSQEKYAAVWSMDFVDEHSLICFSSDLCIRLWSVKHGNTVSTMRCTSTWQIQENDDKDAVILVWKWTHQSGPLLILVSLSYRILFVCEGNVIFTISQKSSQIIQWNNHLIILDKNLSIFKIDEQMLLETINQNAKPAQVYVELFSLVGQVSGPITGIANHPSENKLWGWCPNKLILIDLLTLQETSYLESSEDEHLADVFEIFPFRNQLIVSAENTWAYDPQTQQQTVIYEKSGRNFQLFGSHCFCFRGNPGFRQTSLYIQNHQYEVLFTFTIEGFVQAIAIWKNAVYCADLFRKMHARKVILSWQIIRLVWLGWFQQDKEDEDGLPSCLLSLLPKEIISYIIAILQEDPYAE